MSTGGRRRVTVCRSEGKRMLCTFLVAVLALVGTPAFASSLAEVRGAFADVRDGKREADAAAAVIENYFGANRNSPLAMAYMGSVRTLQSDREDRPWKKMAYLDEGFDLLDRSVALIASDQVPDAVAVEVLMISGVTNASVPALFRRRASALENLQNMIARSTFQELDEVNQARAYAWLAVLTSKSQPENSAAYIAQARRLDQPLAEDIWSKR